MNDCDVKKSCFSEKNSSDSEQKLCKGVVQRLVLAMPLPCPYSDGYQWWRRRAKSTIFGSRVLAFLIILNSKVSFSD